LEPPQGRALRGHVGHVGVGRQRGEQVARAAQQRQQRGRRAAAAAARELVLLQEARGRAQARVLRPAAAPAQRRLG